MNLSNLAARLISAAVLTCAASASHASFTFSTLTGANTATTYFNSLGPLTAERGIDTFNDLTINQPLGVTSLNRSAGPIAYTVSTESQLYTTQANGIGGTVLSVENATDTLTFSNFNPSEDWTVKFFGARFFLSDLSYGVNAGLMTVRATDVDGLTQNFSYSQNVNASTGGATEPVFFTLGSTAALASVQLIAPGIVFDADGNPVTNPLVFASIDNVVVGAVPLPAAGWLLISGLGAMGFLKRRRS